MRVDSPFFDTWLDPTLVLGEIMLETGLWLWTQPAGDTLN